MSGIWKELVEIGRVLSHIGLIQSSKQRQDRGVLDQRRRDNSRVGGGASSQIFSMKFKAFIFTNSKRPKIFRRNIKISDNPTIPKNVRGP